MWNSFLSPLIITYHQGYNCETHCWCKYPHPKRRDITLLDFSSLPVPGVHLFSHHSHDVELHWRWCSDDLPPSALWSVNWSEQLMSHLRPTGSRTANFISFPSTWLICERTRQDKRKRKWLGRRINVTAITSSEQESLPQSAAQPGTRCSSWRGTTGLLTQWEEATGQKHSQRNERRACWDIN